MLCCRLLGLAPDAQSKIFDLYQAILEASIRSARKEGKYDEGIVDVKATAITLAQDPPGQRFLLCNWKPLVFSKRVMMGMLRVWLMGMVRAGYG